MINRKLLKFISLTFLICLFSCNSNNNHAEFSIWTVGSSDINARFGTNIYQALDNLRETTGQLDNFLFTIAEKPLTIDQIRKKSGLTQSQVEYFITYLDSCNFIKKYNQNQWATTLPVITDNQMKIIRKDLTPMAKSVAQYISKETPQLKTLYEKVKSPMDPSWEDISHLIIDKLIIDATFHSNLNRLKRESDISETDVQKMSVIPAFLLQKGGNNLNFGCNWYKFNEGDDQREVYVLHGAIMDRFDIAMNKYRRDKQFSASLFKISPEGGMDSLTNQEKEKLRDLDWIFDDRLLVPIVKASTLKKLMPTIENIGREAAKVAFTKFTNLSESYNKSSYSKFLDYKEDYIQVLIHSLFGLTIEQLVKNGTVSQVPETVPESFSVYIVSGKLY